MKKAILNWIRIKVGFTPDLQQFAEQIQDIEGRMVIYDYGEFQLMSQTSNGNVEPIIFPTAQERNSFAAGLVYGIEIMGGTTSFLNKNDKKALDEMDEQSTHFHVQRHKLN